MTMTQFLNQLHALDLRPTGRRIGGCEIWRHADGRPLPIPQVTFKSPSARMAASKSIPGWLERN